MPMPHLLDIQTAAPGDQPHETAHRDVTFDDGIHTVDVLSRDALAPGLTLKGPVVIEQTDCTIILPPRTSAEVHTSGSIIVEVAL